MDPNKGLIPLKLKLRERANPPRNKKRRARQRPTTDTPLRKTKQKIGGEGGDSTSQREKSRRGSRGEGWLISGGTLDREEGRAAEEMIHLNNAGIATDSEEIERDH